MTSQQPDPTDSVRPTPDSAHVVEARRTSFGAVADVYDQVRPEWPIETLTWLMGSPAGQVDVLELGAGTGKGTRPMVQAGHRVTATEPSTEMLGVLRRSIEQANGGSLPEHVQLHEAVAEELPVPDAAYDAIVCLQAWHWVDPAKGGAECQRVLRPGGVLGLGWHNMDLHVDWVGELNRITHGDAIFTKDKDVWMDPHAEGFSEWEKTSFRYENPLDPDRLALLADSWSFVQVAPDREQILENVRALGHEVADADGRVLLPYTTACVRATRLD